MASKEIMVSAALLVLLYERTFLSGTFAAALRRSWPLYIGLALGWILLYTAVEQTRSNTAGFGLVPPQVWWLTQCKVLMLYLKLVIWPWPLAIHYQIPYILTPAAGWKWAACVGLLAILTLIAVVRRSAGGFIGTFCFAIVAPTSIIPMPLEIAAERRMYLPLAAITTLIIIGVYRLIARLIESKRAGIATMGLSCAVAIVLAVLSIERLSVWGDPLTLWQDTVDHQPNSAVAHNNLGIALAAAGRRPEAIAHYQLALALNPDFYEADDNLGIELAMDGKYEQALPHLQNALRVQPNSPSTQNNLAIVLSDLHRGPEAITHFKKSLQLQPTPGAYIGLADAYADGGQYADALSALDSAHALAAAANNRDLMDTIQMKITSIRRRGG
jgi:tetratricopeptide (TPR) repeat protein